LQRIRGCPISRSFFARYEIPRLLTESFGPRKAFKVEIRGIPHLAKNERDVGHP
jgi:hypothetical protein